MDRRTPRVSIGLPVYNGGRFLEETLTSILAQTYRDFELIISDNASTDRTEEICQAFALRDQRIRYVRSDTNRGAMWNFRRVFHLSSGEYFKWSADDDLLAPEFLTRCVDVLDSHPMAVLCFSRFIEVDERGRFLRRQAYPLRFCSDKPHRRLRTFLERSRHSQTMFGLMRRDVVQQTRLFAPYYGSDRHFLAELSLYGCFEEVEEELFMHREHPQRSAYTASPDQWWDPRATGTRALTYWRIVANIVRIIQASSLDRRERVRCYAELARRTCQRVGYLVPLTLRELRNAPTRRGD